MPSAPAPGAKPSTPGLPEIAPRQLCQPVFQPRVQPHFEQGAQRRFQNEFQEMKRSLPFRSAALALFSLALLYPAVSRAQTAPAESAPKSIWSPVQFAIVKFNDDAPKSWNMYHTDRKGLLLVRIWKRYLFVDLNDEEVYDIDPRKVVVKGDTVEFSFGDVPDKPIDTPEFKERNVGMLQRIRFRLGKDGHILELQMPLGPTGRPIY
jgi:hypothetical protein